MTTPYIGKLAQLLRGNGGNPETFTFVGGVQKIGGVDIKAAAVDTTALGPGNWTTKMAGLLDAGSCALTIEYDPNDSQQQGILEDTVTRTTRDWKLQFPDGSNVWAFSAFVSAFKGPTLDPKGLMVIDVTLELTGEPTWQSGVAE
jgi:Lambda phage tail tube protein, TTP